MDYTEVAQFPSSSSSKIYTVKRDENGELSCDCPAWRFKKGDKPRSCKHVGQTAAGQAPPPLPQPLSVTTFEGNPGEVMEDLLSGIEDHKADGVPPETFTEKMRRLDREA